MTDAALWVVGLGLLGLVFGSFIATLALRWPGARSALSGRSMCDGCGRTLTARELVPLLSWALQAGRCRTCRGAISPLHPVVEATGALIGVAAALAAPGVAGVSGAIFGWLLLAAGAVDFVALRLPRAVTLAIALGGVTTGGFGLAPPLSDRLMGGVAGFVALWGVASLYRLLRGREGLGAGDGMLLGAIGLWLGWRSLAPVVLIASLLGLGVVAVQSTRGRRPRGDDRLPLGTLLAAAAILMWHLQIWSARGTA